MNSKPEVPAADKNSPNAVPTFPVPNGESKPEEENEVAQEEEQGLSGALQAMAEQFSKKLKLEEEAAVQCAPLLPKESLNLEGIATGITEGIFKNIIIMSGAGISVAAGIPDFRTPGTGLYSQLEKYELQDPTDIFTLNFFRENPKPFNVLAKGMFPGKYKPTFAHYFVKLLEQKDILLRNYTQNIDTLEREAGVPGEKLVEAHGSFSAAHCIICHRESTIQHIKDDILNDKIPTCACGGFIKPDIVFFGEDLPKRFFQLSKEDFAKCDLLIVMGTSLTVHPFASLLDKVGDTCVRLLINREEVGVASAETSLMDLLMGRSFSERGFRFNTSTNTRDVKWLGDIQDGIQEFAKLLGWEDELTALAN